MQFAGGAAVFGAFIALYFLVVVYSLYTRRGSGINQHPYRNPTGAAPGASRRSSLSHDDRATIDYGKGIR